MKYIVMDIGGTFIKHAVMDENFNEELMGETPTEFEPEKFLAQLVSVIKSYGEGYGGVAISMAGFINPETGENTDYGCSERFTRYNLKEELAKQTGYRISIENDSNCAALAESVIGAGKGRSTICAMTVGTGIGGAIITDGKLFRGKSFKAGEYGFAIVGFEKDEEGNTVPRYAKATSILSKRCSEALGRTVNGKQVMQLLDTNSTVKEIYDAWISDIAFCIGNVCVALDPEVFLVGGGISGSARFMADLKARTYGLFEKLDEYTEILPCSLGNNAGKAGALIIFFEKYGK